MRKSMGITEDDIKRGLGASIVTRVGPAQTGGGECWKVEIGGTEFAAKFATSDFESDRFERGKEVLEEANSPHVVKLSGAGTLDCADGNSYPYTLCEFVAGGNVREKLASGVRPSDEEIRSFARGLFEGLQVLDSLGVVHRDIKPENIMLSDGDWSQPVLIDFGYTKLINGSSRTIYPWAGGTAPYMSPEQWVGEPARVRSDVWAATVVVLEVANGAHPFAEVNDWRNAVDVLERLEQPPTLTDLVPAEVKRWSENVNDFRGYRRKDAAGAIKIMGQLWP